MLKRLRSFVQAEWQSIRVILTFLALIIGFFFVLSWEPIVRYVDIGAGMAKLAAWMTYGLMRVVGPALGLDVHLNGTIMGAGDFEVDVSPACSGAVPTSIYLSAVLAYPASGRSKVIGAGLGMIVIHMINLVRVAALFLIGLYYNQIFHETHVYVAQALVVAAAVALWLFWAGRFAHAPGR